MIDKTKMQEVEVFLTRGVENVYPSYDWVKKQLLSGKKLKMYLGIDPTGPNLHLGHMIQLIKLKQFQDLGHEIILLIGDFTGMIGDPTDKSAARKKLSRKEVLANCKNYKKQAGKVLNFKKCKIKYNSSWLAKLSFKEVVELASNFTVQRMLERDMFEQRMKVGKPIHVHEFLYPLMQAYDSVAMDVDAEVGGNDQTFNMLCGRDLMKTLKNKEKFVLTTKLLADTTGKKMGKTEGNMVALSDSSKQKFGKVMSWADEMIEIGFELLTDRSLDDIKKRLQEENPRDLKMELAYELVKKFDDEKQAIEARENFINVFSKKQKPDDIKKIQIKSEKKSLVDLIFETKMASSKSEAKRLIEQGGVKINDQIIRDIKTEIKPENGMVLQVGKRKFVELEI